MMDSLSREFAFNFAVRGKGRALTVHLFGWLKHRQKGGSQ